MRKFVIRLADGRKQFGHQFAGLYNKFLMIYRI